MSTYKTINGWAHTDGTFLGREHQPFNDPAWKPATLIQWDGPPQRVFSEDQVRAMIEEVLNETPDAFKPWIIDIAKRHNITL